MITERIALLKPSISTKNKGDSIIVDKCQKILEYMLPNSFFCDVSTHNIIDELGRSIIDTSNYCIVCGSGILTSDLFKGRMKGGQWMVDLNDFDHNVILMGVGWENYDSNITQETIDCYHQFLSKNCIHSVRDEYTKNKLAEIGITNVVNTGCPTLWELNEKQCMLIPKAKSANVVLSFNYHKQDIHRDKLILDTARELYHQDCIYFWAQSQKDIDYAQSIGLEYDKEKTITHLSRYTDFLKLFDVDYVGCRLHGGIHALNNRNRAFIIPVDNRAAEMGNDFKLPVFNAVDLKRVIPFYETEISIDVEKIYEWKGQFISS